MSEEEPNREEQFCESCMSDEEPTREEHFRESFMSNEEPTREEHIREIREEYIRKERGTILHRTKP